MSNMVLNGSRLADVRDGEWMKNVRYVLEE